MKGEREAKRNCEQTGSVNSSAGKFSVSKLASAHFSGVQNFQRKQYIQIDKLSHLQCSRKVSAVKKVR